MAKRISSVRRSVSRLRKMPSTGKLPRMAMALAPLALAGCITAFPDITQSRSPCRNAPGGWCDFVREAAVGSYGYAMLSSNSYRDDDTYTELGPAFEAIAIIPPEEGEDRAGFAYSLFDQYAVTTNADGSVQRGKRTGRVMAIRGTEFSGATDIIKGSLQDAQKELARKLLAAEMARFSADYPGLGFVVTGHSLGGALATQLSIEYPEVRAHVFNMSPFFSGDPMVNDTNRVAIAERGEFLRFLRQFREAPASEMLVLNCAPASSSGTKHGIRLLADCLTWIAAYDDPAALALIDANGIAKPPVECGPADKVHPKIGGTQQGPCVHVARPLKPDEDG